MVRAFDPVVDGNILQFKYNHQNNTIVDMHKGSEWNFEEGFWFEWVAFHPDMELYIPNLN